jgi:hypothetical protein
MFSSFATLLQLALSLLLAAQTSTSSPVLQQQAISTATQAMQLVIEAMQSSGQQSQAPSLLTYHNDEYGITFQYPSTDALSENTATSLLFDGLNPPGDEMIIAIVLPSSTYGNQDSYWTNTRDIEVWREDTPVGTSSCLTQYPPSAVGGAVNFPSEQTIGGSDWIFNSDSVDNMTTETDVFEYSTLSDGTCYSVRYESTSFPNLVSPETLIANRSKAPSDIEPLSSTPSDEEQAQTTFLHLLNTVRF